ncbi:unnamed protein product [Closterium sp. NIES-54]
MQVTVSEEEISGVTEDGGEPEVEEQQQQQQQDAPPRAQRPVDCPRRDVRPPNRLTYPSFGTPKVALSGSDAEKWKQSVKEEYDSLLENETWELCELPPGKKAISSKLIFRHKYGPDGELTCYKSRLVAKGFQQTKGKDFDEIFAPVRKWTTLRVMLGTAANSGWRIKQMDITTAFLNGIILEELYMLQPEGLDDGSGRVCRLKKAIYGLKQAPRAWYHKLEETLLAGGFKKSECGHSLFLLQEKEQFLMLLVYVDDILLLSESSAMIEHVEEMLEMQFKCSKMGDVKYYLGMHVERDLDKGMLRLHHRKYCEGLAEKYGLQDGGKPATPLPSGFTVEPCADEEVVGESDRKLFHSMVGALNYAANHTRPDIAFATSRLASVVSHPSHEQLEAAKRLVLYMSATASVGLEYSAVRQRLQMGAADLRKGEMLLTCYSDASFNSVKADGTSIGGYVCLFGGGAVSWRSKKQNEVGLSSCETEYMALHHGAKEVVWLRHLLEEIGVCQKEPTVILCDNESAVKLAKNACHHGPTKHIRPKWHWVRRLLDKEVRLEIVKTHQQAADILTKRLAENEHWKGMKLAGMSAPREWHDTLRTTLAFLGFAPSTADPTLFLRTDTTLPPFYVLVYVDDLVFATADTEPLAHVKSELQKRHTCTDLGELTSYLGLRITRDRAQRTITLTRSHMVQQVLQRFGFTYSSPQSTPLPTGHSLSAPPSDESVEPSGPYPELVGCLMYLMTCTRPDLAYPLSLLARYVAPGKHRKVHWDAAKRVLRYLCSTSGMGLVLGGRARVVLTGHADASWVDDLATQRSSQGYTFNLGSGSVSWRSTRSSSVLSSSCEAEIYAGAMAAQELRWLTYQLTDLGEAPRSPPVLYVDNKAMLALCQEHRLEHRTKHIALRYFLTRELQQRGQLRLAYVASQANTADVFTKALQPCDHQRFCTVLGLVPTVPHLLSS